MYRFMFRSSYILAWTCHLESLVLWAGSLILIGMQNGSICGQGLDWHVESIVMCIHITCPIAFMIITWSHL